MLAILKEYSTRFAFPSFGISDIIEIFLIAFLIYKIIGWFRGSKAGTIIKGIVVLVGFTVLASILHFDAILWLLQNSLTFGITAALIIFQPELRRALEELGKGNFIASLFTFDTTEGTELFDEQVITEIGRAATEMSRTKTGALIVIERGISLQDYEKTGILIDGKVSSQLLVNIFEHNTPLHDGAVIIRGNRIVAATCYLPLTASQDLSKELGTRHRAAVGISEVTDSYTIVVSEETGAISLAYDRRLIRNLTIDDIKGILLRAFSPKDTEKARIKLWKGLRANEDKSEE
ncbi:MAG: TIGR00159 family protein [Lachnospiraceae bacterium]|nr:TIGR00159 family protein [Lachnospiraceae bacterium]